jgi:hypothetical protein
MGSDYVIADITKIDYKHLVVHMEGKDTHIEGVFYEHGCRLVAIRATNRHFYAEALKELGRRHTKLMEQGD